MVELDYNFNLTNVKIADFGTAKLFVKDANEQHTPRRQELQTRPQKS